jgi:DNA mismatch repair protein MutL
MDRRPIKQLPQSLVNRIAAGEVIERPASVVKELIENSIDAGATDILIEIEDGGRALIRITDNGSGIPSDELPLAFAAHATSKLDSDEDLFRIQTMGFRGEALASIGSVSQSRIVSRPLDQMAAYAIVNDGGQVTAAQAAAANVGTSIEVRNLFFNTPARRKFLRGTATEFGHISQTILRLALPFPQISFKLIHNGRKSMDLPRADPLHRLLEAWPREFHDLYLPIHGQFSEVSIGGIVGLPELARPTPLHQYLYLNGRSIRDKFISHALREAYRGLTEPGRHPAAVILLTLPPDEADVNVHPTKSEIRFRDGSRIHSIVHSAVREKLLSSDLAPAAVPVLSAMEASDEKRQNLREKLAEFFQQPLPPGAEPAQSPPPPSMPVEQRLRAPAIQLHNSYLVAQTEDGMIIIDQHALHERIIYEELLARVSGGPLESQRLLIPMTFPASPRQIELLEQIKPTLAQIGIEAEPFGPDSIAVQSFPSFLSRLDPATFVMELLERGEQELLDMHGEELLHDVLDMMACKAAVKAGDPLTPPEIEAMLARRSSVDRSSNCPHGRPTTLRLTLKDLEKQFKRTGF